MLLRRRIAVTISTASNMCIPEGWCYSQLCCGKPMPEKQPSALPTATYL
jgi:hypothetical protein